MIVKLHFLSVLELPIFVIASNLMRLVLIIFAKTNLQSYVPSGAVVDHVLWWLDKRGGCSKLRISC
jgi:hypothetical protein